MAIIIYHDLYIFFALAIYLVRAKPKIDTLNELRERLESGEISDMRPFGTTLHDSLKNARIDNIDGYAEWEEEDYCSPPLAMERKAVLDRHFEDISVERVEESGLAWKKVQNKPNLWTTRAGSQ